MATDLEERLVRQFCVDAWNRWDDAVVDELLSADFALRSSLGNEVVGREGWRGYRDMVQRSAPDFHNEIVDLVAAAGRVAVRLLYSGHQRGGLLGYAGRGEPFEYAGAAFSAAPKIASHRHGSSATSTCYVSRLGPDRRYRTRRTVMSGRAYRMLVIGATVTAAQLALLIGPGRGVDAS